MSFITQSTKLLAGITLVAASILPAHADVIALDPTRATGNQGWQGALGMDFDVLAPIVITQLGAYDSSSNGFAGTIRVGIFNRDTQTLVGSLASLTSANTTAVGAFNRFMDTIDFQLGVGHYSIVADGFNNTDPNGNAGAGGLAPTINTGGGLINFLGTSRYAGQNASFVFPTILDGGPSNRYDAGTFQFKAVPEPASLALLGLGLLGLAGVRRRR